MNAQPGPHAAISTLDSVRACVGIPVFNNVATVAKVVEGARRHASVVLVYDDGSTDGSGDAARAAGGEVLGGPPNRGKGVALRALLQEAQRRGFDTLVCLDADGQHDPEDLPKLAEGLRQHPGALLIGRRDLAAAHAPSSSRFGKAFSNFWVWLETGLDVEDSQSGYRAYPVAKVTKLPLRRRRFDFELELLLRAAWAGVPLQAVPIGVVYPEARVSHFDKWRDNVRLTSMNLWACARLLLPWSLGPALHARAYRPGLSLWAIRRWFWLGGPGLIRRGLAAALCVAALLTTTTFGVGAAFAAAALSGVGVFLPLLGFIAATQLARFDVPVFAVALGLVAGALLFGLWEHGHQPQASAPTTWSGRSDAPTWGYALFLRLIRWFGRGAAYAALYPVVLYYALVAAPARAASTGFLDRALGPPRSAWQRFGRTYRHLLTFSQCLVDRALLSALGPSAFQTRAEHSERLVEASRSGSGALLLSAHLGNWDLGASLLGSKLQLPVSVVAFHGEEGRIARDLERAQLRGRVSIISVGTDELSSLEVVRALRAGRLVALQGDRLIDERSVRVPFLGAEAPFPVGPFLLAALAHAPVITTFALKEGPTTYRVLADAPRTYHFTPGQNRQEQLRAWAAEYAQRLEALVCEYPFQWFNFYDFWNARPVQPAPQDRARL